MKNILILGATSAMAQACARQWVARGDRVFLVGRREAALAADADDLRLRGQGDPVGTRAADLADVQSHAGVLDAAWTALGTVDIVLIAYGALPDQGLCETQLPEALAQINLNGVSAVALAHQAALRLQQQGHGTLAAITSVAGDRGRGSNYVYGSAKALLSAYLSGLGQALSKKNIQVVDIRPGFVASPMTAHLPKGPLWAQPVDVAKQILRAIDRGQPVAYTPGFWALIMFMIRHLPDRLFRRLSL